jgi:S-adenosylmethionine synthetase
MQIALSKTAVPQHSPTEIVERKGLGHPDSICDALAEEVSLALCRYYLREFGTILHHNVDKALLVGGISKTAFGGGQVLQPIEFILAGRAVLQYQGKSTPVEELVRENIDNWVRQHLRYLKPAEHLSIQTKIRPGSTELTELFGRAAVPLCNDTSIGVGYYPYSTCESLTLEMADFLNDSDTRSRYPYLGEDIKVMGLRSDGELQYTVAAAFVDTHIASLADYIEAKRNLTQALSLRFNLPPSHIALNMADDIPRGSIYLTVTGTSAESGDDGQVGRGNRLNGLITPFRPMTLEAYSGKNPVSHVGKTYNYFAGQLSRALVEHGFAASAQVFLVSQIGKPVDQPQLVSLQLEDSESDPQRIRDFVREQLHGLATIWQQIVG